MGRMIDADDLIEELNRYEKELRNDREVAIETDDEQMLFAIMNQETAICRIRRNAFNIPTAYNVEAVVAELEKNSYEEYCSCCEIVRLKNAIDIVRKGGIE